MRRYLNIIDEYNYSVPEKVRPFYSFLENLLEKSDMSSMGTAEDIEKIRQDVKKKKKNLPALPELPGV